MEENSLIYYGIVIFGSIAVAFIIHRLLRTILKKFIDISEDGELASTTHYKFINNALGLVLIIITSIVIFSYIPSLRKFGAGIFASAGILAAFVGFASQAALSNIISGLFIVIFKPFRVNDIIAVGDNWIGTVEDITLRHTIIRNAENKRFIIPNSNVSSETIQNFTLFDRKVNNFIAIGISYDADINKAMEIMQDEALKHPNCIDNREKEEMEGGIPAVKVRVINLGESSIDLRADVWSASPGKGFELKCDLLKSIIERFNKEGIELPFHHRMLVYKNEE